MRSLLLGAALAAMASAQSACFKEYQCMYHYLNDRKTQEFSWDLRSLCNADQNYTFVVPGQTYSWSIIYTVCGNVSYACNPRWSHSVSHGVAIQSWMDTLTPIGSMTTDPESGLQVPMTYPCEVLGHDRPIFDIIDPTDPADGIVMIHSSMAPMAADPNGCAIDTRTGYPRERELKMFLHCDRSIPRDQMVVDDLTPFGGRAPFVEVGSCQYEFHLRSSAGCGINGDPFDLVATKSDPGTNFGFVVLGGFVTIGLQFALAWADTRGYLTGMPQPVSKLLGLSGGAKAGFGGMSIASAGSSGSAGAAAPFAAKPAYGSL